MVAIVLGTGFEEVEALTACDILRRGGVNVKLAGIGGEVIEGAHGIRVVTDAPVEVLEARELEMIVLPGGLGGVESIMGSPLAMDAVRRTYESGGIAAAICAAPVALAKLGLTDGKNAVCYPGMDNQMGSAIMHPDREVVRDGRVITGRAPAAATPFALELLSALRGEGTAASVAADLVYEG